MPIGRTADKNTFEYEGCIAVIATLSKKHRVVIAEIATVILPGGNGQPAAKDIGIECEPIDRVLKSRADLAGPFIAILDNYNALAESFLLELTAAEFNLLMTVLCAAYVMDKRVRNALNYPGQQALTLDRGGFGAEELVIEMMHQPKRFRPV